MAIKQLPVLRAPYQRLVSQTTGRIICPRATDRDQALERICVRLSSTCDLLPVHVKVSLIESLTDTYRTSCTLHQAWQMI